MTSVATHKHTQTCDKALLQRQKREAAQANCDAKEVVFTIGDKEIETVTQFKYLGRILHFEDDDLLAVIGNINKARKRWGTIMHLLSRTGANPRTMGYFYKAVVQSTLLYGSESWVLTERMLGMVEAFHHKCARFIAQDFIHQDENGEWHYPSSAAVLEKCGLYSIREYIARRKSTVRSYVVQRPIFTRCTASKPTQSNVNQKVWWLD